MFGILFGSCHRSAKFPHLFLRFYDMIEGGCLVGWRAARSGAEKNFHRRASGLGCQRAGERVAGFEWILADSVQIDRGDFWPPLIVASQVVPRRRARVRSSRNANHL